MKKLKIQKTIKVKPLKPFAFDSTFYKPDHFTTGDNYWKKGIRWQTFNWQKQTIGVKFLNKGTVNKPLIEIKIYATKKLSNNFLVSFVEEIKYRYNLNYNLRNFYDAFKDDEFLSPILKKMKGMRPGHPSSLYEYLIIGIILQNASIKRSVYMFKTLLEKYGTLLEFDGKKLSCIWAPGRLKKINEQELRNLKVGYRAKSIKKIDEYFVEGLVDEYKLRLKDRETQMEELLKLYGVGPATVWYLLFDVFHHWDFFDHISPWEQKIYSKLFFNKDTKNPVPVKKILKYFKKFGIYKQLAVHYIWEDLWWKRKTRNIEWLEKEIRL